MKEQNRNFINYDSSGTVRWSRQDKQDMVLVVKYSDKIGGRADSNFIISNVMKYNNYSTMRKSRQDWI